MLGKVELMRVAAWSLALVSSFLWKVGLSGQQLPLERHRDHQKTIKIDVFLALYYMCFLDCTWRILKSNLNSPTSRKKAYISFVILFFCVFFASTKKNRILFVSTSSSPGGQSLGRFAIRLRAHWLGWLRHHIFTTEFGKASSDLGSEEWMDGWIPMIDRYTPGLVANIAGGKMDL